MAFRDNDEDEDDKKEERDDFEDLAKQVPILIEQLNHLYQNFVTGILLRPPFEERARLEKTLLAVQKKSHAVAMRRFRFATLNTSYQTNSQRWDKLVHDVETGKIKRIVGPKRDRGKKPTR